MIRMNIKECCEGLKDLLEFEGFLVSSQSKKGWLKIAKHDGTMDLDKCPPLRSFDVVEFCPFCGAKIENNEP
jgi:hypothetical protein